MMPTRLQDGLSMPLLQWSRSVSQDATRTVLVRINDLEIVSVILQNLENAGLSNIRKHTDTSYIGEVTAGDLSQIAHCHGVCAVTAYDIAPRS